MIKGKLYLIPVALGENTELAHTMPPYVQQVINGIDEYIVENEKTARRNLKQMGRTRPLQEIILHTLNEQTPVENILNYLDAIDRGKDMGLMSEAGCPGVADPGAELVRLAHSKNIQVMPLVGPSSILLALMASGMNGQNFCFNGYLPKEQKERINKLKELERLVLRNDQTQLFIETPYRNNHIIEDVLNTCSNELRFCIACDITLPTELIKTQTIAQWKKQKPDINKRPAMFIIGR
ncbi:MAG: SAM-dependent methyltransferase [Bacteroidetes bacterium]|nr:SAM-dependent methyltransferase [Bacteroidota bacterium]